MKAYIIEHPGGPEILKIRDVPSPSPKADEVRIKVKAFGLNRAEVYRRAGKMGPISAPVILGIEAVGTVIEDPSGTFRVGQRVGTAMGGMQFSRNGSYAEEVTVLRSNVVDLDATKLDWDDLAALPESYLTVWGALGRLIAQKTRPTVLVRGATSSVGQAAVVYAKAEGATVIATTRAAANLDRLRAIGADVALIDSGDVHTGALTQVPGGVDLALEVVGAATIRDTIKAVQPFGSVVVIGLLGGPPIIDNLNLMSDLPQAVAVSFFGSGILGTPALPLHDAPLVRLAERIANKSSPSLRVRTFAFDEIPQAHRLMESDQALGKLVVRL